MPKDSLLKKGSSDYLRLMKDQASLYHGAEYIAPKQLIEGFPFFGQEAYYDGLLVLSGVHFFSIPIHYDLVHDALLIWSFDRSILLVLNTEKVERFELGQHSFIRGALIKQNSDELPKGFFQVIHEGRVMAVAKKQKVVVQKSASDKSYAFYKQFNNYYLILDGNWKQVNSEQAVMNVFKSAKDELKKFIQKRNLSYRKSPENFLKEVTAYYETLTSK